MIRAWESVLTLSIVHFMIYPEAMAGTGAVSESLEKLALDDFLGAAEITSIKDPAERARVRAIAKQAGLQLGFGCQPQLLMPKLNLNDPDPAGRKTAVDRIKECIDEAAEMGCQRAAVLTGVDPGDAGRAKGLDLLADSMKTLCGYGQGKGIAMTVETFDRDVDKKCLLGPSDVSAQFAARIREDYADFGLMYDLSHQPLLFEKSTEALTLLKDYLVHIHVGNAVVTPGVPGYGDLHPRFGWPGGANDVPELVEFLRGLFTVGYLSEGTARPWIGFEVKPQGDGETSELIIAGSKRVWEDAWSRV